MTLSSFYSATLRPVSVDAAVIKSLFSTGVNSINPDGTPLSLVPQGSPDSHYQLISAPAPVVTGPAYAVIESGYPFFGPSAAWPVSDGQSSWIAPHANQNSLSGGASNEPAGSYVYRTMFDLTGFDPTTAMISGIVFADNSVSGIYLNGTDTGVSGASFNGSSFSISTGFSVGVNILDIEVFNAPGRRANPSAMRLEVHGSADELPPPPPPPSVPEPSSLIIGTVLAGCVVAFRKVKLLPQ